MHCVQGLASTQATQGAVRDKQCSPHPQESFWSGPWLGKGWTALLKCL